MSAITTTYFVSVIDLPLQADIGIHRHEIGRLQPIIVSVRLTLERDTVCEIAETVDYRLIVDQAQCLAGQHVDLIETFAERLARSCMHLGRVSCVRVDVQKPQALAAGRATATVVVRSGSHKREG